MCTSRPRGPSASALGAEAFTYLRVEGAAVLVDFINQFSYRFWRSEARNAMSKIEHMAALAHRTERVQHAARFRADGAAPPKKRHRIQVALERDRVAGA